MQKSISGPKFFPGRGSLMDQMRVKSCVCQKYCKDAAISLLKGKPSISIRSEQPYCHTWARRRKMQLKKKRGFFFKASEGKLETSFKALFFFFLTHQSKILKQFGSVLSLSKAFVRFSHSNCLTPYTRLPPLRSDYTSPCAQGEETTANFNDINLHCCFAAQ